MAKGRHSRGRHRGLGRKFPQTPPPWIRLCDYLPWFQAGLFKSGLSEEGNVTLELPDSNAYSSVVECHLCPLI